MIEGSWTDWHSGDSWCDQLWILNWCGVILGQQPTTGFRNEAGGGTRF